MNWRSYSETLKKSKVTFIKVDLNSTNMTDQGGSAGWASTSNDISLYRKLRPNKAGRFKIYLSNSQGSINTDGYTIAIGSSTYGLLHFDVPYQTYSSGGYTTAYAKVEIHSSGRITVKR